MPTKNGKCYPLRKFPLWIISKTDSPEDHQFMKNDRPQDQQPARLTALQERLCWSREPLDKLSEDPQDGHCRSYGLSVSKAIGLVNPQMIFRWPWDLNGSLSILCSVCRCHIGCSLFGNIFTSNVDRPGYQQKIRVGLFYVRVCVHLQEDTGMLRP